MDQWPLDDGLAQADEDEEHDKVERADDGKGSRQASYGVGERISCRKGEVDDGDDQQYSNIVSNRTTLSITSSFTYSD